MEIFGEEVLVENVRWKIWEEVPNLISMNPLLFKILACIGYWKNVVFVFVCVSLYLCFCKSSSWSLWLLSSPDDKLSENIWFLWSKTSHDGDKWRCHHGDKRTNERTNKK